MPLYKKTIAMKQLLLISIFLSFSCTKDKTKYNVPCSTPTSDITISKTLILGNWTWAYEKYLDRIAQAYITKTPQTEGYTRQYEFFKKGDVKIYQNQNLIETATYEITTLNVVTGSSFDNDKKILLFKNKSTGQRIDLAPLTICNDTLTLNYQAYLDTKGQEKWSKD
jgi:hypothetical protein